MLDQIGSRDGGKQEILPEEMEPIKFQRRYATGFVKQFTTNMKRSLRTFWRNPGYNYTRIVNGVVQAMILGFAFFQVERNQAGATVIVGAIFMGAFYSLVSISASVTSVIGDRVAFYRESAAGAYNAAAYYLSIGIADLPFNFVASTLFATIFYFLVGFPGNL